MEDFQVGLIGFGTIGAGVTRLLHDNEYVIKKRLGHRIRLKKIADIDITTPRGVDVPDGVLTTDANDILNDPGIRVVIELVGGYEPAKSFVLSAIGNGKHVVTANKALLATYGTEIFNAANEKNVDIGFEASVGGTIPVIKTLKEALAANNITSFLGIMNGTCNYILSTMTEKGGDFADVLKKAKELGFAEADATFDIDGIDTAHKLAITLSLAYGKNVELDAIYREGISSITQNDIEFARELGYRVKLLAIAIERGDVIEARIHPTMIPHDHLLSSVNSNFNAFHFNGDASGSVFLYGQGAGMMPTASAVVSDIIDIGRNCRSGSSGRVPLRSFQEENIDDVKLLPMDDIVTNYYLRFSAVDRPGVLSKISGILGAHHISIASVIQKGRKKEGAVPVVMTTHEAREKNMRQALEEIDKLDIVLDRTVLIRIEDGALV